MPPKIRQLKAALTKAGCYVRPGKGSHTVWQHAALPGLEITLAGGDGDDAKPYQEKDVRNLLRQLKRSRE
jgi:predicted RNA binding protein YcfA (HicA-like mRNA interferase family)